MQFYYFNAQGNKATQTPFQRFFLRYRTKSVVQKTIIKPLKQAHFTIFHLHEITQGLFHIVITKKDSNELLNCFFDAKEQVFFFEKEEDLLNKIQQSPLGEKLVVIDPSVSNYHLLTAKDILNILDN